MTGKGLIQGRAPNSLRRYFGLAIICMRIWGPSPNEPSVPGQGLLTAPVRLAG